jgi:hypothetical protein
VKKVRKKTPAVFATAGMVLAALTVAHAELLLDGSPDAVVLQAKRAELSEVLDALAGKFDARVRSPIAPNNLIDGT